MCVCGTVDVLGWGCYSTEEEEEEHSTDSLFLQYGIGVLKQIQKPPDALERYTPPESYKVSLLNAEYLKKMKEKGYEFGE